MNAINFIKQHGVENVRDFLKLNSHIKSNYLDPNTWELFDGCHRGEVDLCVKDLKRLVESVELVNHMGGITEIKRKFRDNGSLHGNRLKQAIADYESIYGGEHV